jgi:CSLREA domain-containing protein
LLFVLTLGASSGSSAAVATTFTVNSTGDGPDAIIGNGVCADTTGACTLRAAIQESNASAGSKDTIAFDIPGSEPHLIVVGVPLTVTDAVVIDGARQPGGTPRIEIDVSALNFGLDVETAGSVGTEIHGIAIYGNSSANSRTILFNNRGGNVVERNFIGTDATGTVVKGGDFVVVGWNSTGDGSVSSGNTIADNLISGRNGGVLLDEASDNEVLRNLIGTDVSGKKGLSNGTGNGIVLNEGSSRNLLADNVIAARDRGIRIFAEFGGGHPSEDNRIEGNRIGTDITGTVALGNTEGIDVLGLTPRTIVGGADPAARNVISGNQQFGVSLGGDGTTVQGNFIGTDITGTNGLGNGVTGSRAGIGLAGTRGLTLILDNVISGNHGGGISAGVPGTLRIEGNLIGTNEQGTAKIPNVGDGISISGNLADSVIGGESEAQRNIISGNGGNGITAGNAGLQVLNNYVGTNKVGDAVLGNGGDGVTASGGTIGKPGAGNVISGNSRAGVRVLGDPGAVVQANLIGTDASGKNDLGNGGDGVAALCCSARNARIGGGTAGEGNLIAGNDGWGIELTAQGASVVQGNRIGVDADGASQPNALGGLRIANLLSFGDTADVAENIISHNNGHGVLLTGSLSRVHENVIAFNASDGVAVEGSLATRNTISTNSIFSNSGLGIDLEDDGVTGNDTGDGDGGANLRQNFPVNLEVSTDRKTVTGTLNSRPNMTYQIELFGNSVDVACDGSGKGEGETFLASTEKPTDGSGNAPFTITLQSPLPGGHFVTATATDPAGNTSEFSMCAQVPPESATIVVDKVTNPSGDPQSFSFDASGGGYADFSLTDAATPNSQELAAGKYEVSETVPSGWDLTSATCTSSIGDTETPGNIELDAGEIVTCTFTNTKRGMAKVIKTVNSAAPSGTQEFIFQLRQGSTPIVVGTTLETQTANAGNGGVINFTTKLVPTATYQLCEIVMPGWLTTLGTFVPGSFMPPDGVAPNPDVDNSILCVNFTVTAGETKAFTIDNTPPPGGRALTIGFWKNWASCAQSSGKQKPVLDQMLALAEPVGVQIGDLFLHARDCLKAVRILNKSTINNGTKKSSDPAFNLAAQLLAARLNILALAGTCPAAVTAINAAQALLDAVNFDGTTHDKLSAAQATQANTLARTLDNYNNNRLC